MPGRENTDDILTDEAVAREMLNLKGFVLYICRFGESFSPCFQNVFGGL